MRKLARAATTIAAVPVFVALTAAPALAYECFNTQKKAGSGGSVGVFDVATDSFTPSGAKGNPAFVEIRFPDGSSGFLFIHSAAGKDGVIAGARDCDGKGLDNITACFGG